MIKIISPWFIKIIRWRLKEPKIVAAAIFPGIVVFFDRQASSNQVLCNHEAIHHAQMWEGWIIGHWIMYAWYDKKHGYRKNPFELEAYANQKDMNYLKTRPRNAWKKYL